MSQKNFNLKLPDEDIAEEFYAFIEPKGIKKGYAMAGAMRLFMILPADVREMLTEKDRYGEAVDWFDDLRRKAMAFQTAKAAGRLTHQASRKRRACGKEK